MIRDKYLNSFARRGLSCVNQSRAGAGTAARVWRFVYALLVVAMISPVLPALFVTLAAMAPAMAQAPATSAPATVDAFTALPPGNAEDGMTVFKKCLACHQLGPTAKNSVGPALNGIIGRPAGTYPAYAYSQANKQSGQVWTEATLAAYLPDPMAFLPGTKMTFVGLKTPREVADVIAYLKQFDAKGAKVPPAQ